MCWGSGRFVTPDGVKLLRVTPRQGVRRSVLLVALLAMLAVSVDPGSAVAVAAEPVLLVGDAQSSEHGLAGFDVSLFRAGTSRGEPAEVLATAVTADDGSFELSYDAPAAPDRVLYLVAEPHDVGPGPIALVSVLGSGPLPESVVVNDRTTVASAFGLAQFADGLELAGTSPGIVNAAGMVRNLVDVATGEIGAELANPPNGTETSTLATFNSLANMVAACVASPVECEAFLDLATPPGVVAPGDRVRCARRHRAQPGQPRRPSCSRSRSSRRRRMYRRATSRPRRGRSPCASTATVRA